MAVSRALAEAEQAMERKGHNKAAIKTPVCYLAGTGRRICADSG